MEEEIFYWREANGFDQLFKEEALSYTAELYANELLRLGQLSHRDNKGRGALERYKDAGGTALHVGEVLATQGGGSDVRSILDLWLDSPAHLYVLSNPEWTCYGLAMAEDDTARVVVLLFSNSYIINKTDLQIHTIDKNPIYLNIPQIDKQIVISDRVFLLPHLRSHNLLLLEIRDGENRVHNRWFSSSSEYHEDAE